MRVTGSQVAAILGGFLLLANPNMLYLQATPMTESMLFGHDAGLHCAHCGMA